jgi:hypothetical protein
VNETLREANQKEINRTMVEWMKVNSDLNKKQDDRAETHTKLLTLQAGINEGGYAADRRHDWQITALFALLTAAFFFCFLLARRTRKQAEQIADLNARMTKAFTVLEFNGMAVSE